METPDLARFLTAQSGVQMLECLKRNFFPDEEVPAKWEFGVAPPVAQYMDQILWRNAWLCPHFQLAKFELRKENESYGEAGFFGWFPRIMLCGAGSG